MSTPNVANALRIPGRLSHSPVSLATAYPHGGTALGTVSGLTLRTTQPVFPVTAWELGGAVVDLLDLGSQWSLDAVLREWDADALAHLFPFYATGASGGPLVEYDANSSTRAGRLIGEVSSVVLVFTPDSPDHHPWLILRRAVPAIQETVGLRLTSAAEPGLPCRWYATPNSDGKVFALGRKRDLTL